MIYFEYLLNLFASLQSAANTLMEASLLSLLRLLKPLLPPLVSYWSITQMKFNVSKTEFLISLAVYLKILQAHFPHIYSREMLKRLLKCAKMQVERCVLPFRLQE